MLFSDPFIFLVRGILPFSAMKDLNSSYLVSHCFSNLSFTCGSMPIFLSFSICSGVLDVLSFPFTIFCSQLTQLHSSLPSTMIPFLTLAPTPCSSKYLTASSYIISQCDIKLSRTVLGSSSLNISTLSSLNTPFWIKFLC